MWNFDPEGGRGEALIKDGAIITVVGVSGAYQGTTQIEIKTASPRQSTSDEDFIQTSKFSTDHMWQHIVGTIDGMDDVYIRSVAKDILENTAFVDAFKISPAATGFHHAFRGGLLEHTYQMLEMAEQMFKLPYFHGNLNKDLVMFGVIFHDMGKIYEYDPNPGFKRTLIGITVGHIVLVDRIIQKSCDRLGIAPVIADQLSHMVLSHHGVLEWGSPVTPKTPEAIFLHYLDNMNAKVFGMIQALDNAKKEEVIYDKSQGGSIMGLRYSDIVKKVEEAQKTNENAEGFAW
jgi:3'-5' exoribonuclease